MNWEKQIGHKIVSTARFDHHATTYEGAVEYFVNRAVQLLQDGIRLQSVQPYRVDDEVVGALAKFDYTDSAHVVSSSSLYVLAPHRGNGYFSEWLRKEFPTVLTTQDCDIVHILKERRSNYFLKGNFTQEKEYQAIADYYRYQRARRSGVPYMNHIDEGLAILNIHGANKATKLAYCLHPIFQGDQDLRRNLRFVKRINPSPLVMTYVMEYRKVAQAAQPGGSKPQPSPLEEVNLMLKADKLQNWKDFQMYYPTTDPRTIELEEYFQSWFKALEISYTSTSILQIKPTLR